MSFCPGWLTKTSGAVRASLILGMLGLLVPAFLWADAPAWWAEHGVTIPGATADDYAAVNQGQVKHIAKQAYEEMKELGLIDPVAAAASTNPDDPARRLFLAWQIPTASVDDYQAVNLGQLKNVAEPFYARLQELNYTGQPLASGQTRPWSGTADDYALANIGQVKNLFSFAISIVVDPNDADADGMLDSWEIANFGDLRYTPGGDADSDGLSNLAEFLAGTDPTGSATSVSASVLELSVYSP